MEQENESASARNDMSYLELEGRDLELLGTPQQLAALFGALATAQGAFKPVHKNREVSIRLEGKAGYTFAYAELSQSLDATREALSANGLAVSQPYSLRAGVATVRTILSHKEGGLMISTCELQRANAMKDLGGLLTYARRYAFNAMLSLAADEDLDDQAEAGRGETGASSAPRSQPRTSNAPASGSSNSAPSSASTQDEGPRRLNQTEKAELTKLVREIHNLDPADAEGVRQAVNNAISDYVMGASKPAGYVVNVTDYKPLHALLFARAVKAKQDRSAEGPQS